MLEWMQDIFNGFGDALKDVLPVSPFSQYIDEFRELPYMSYVNWLIPFGDILSVLEVWLGAVVLYYVYSIVLRWVKAIS